ncbi:MAG TPA: hypothetical protein VKN99_26865 [Polyangia bacterium]|nr:hypothetical protein [Polyangia bacterium]
MKRSANSLWVAAQLALALAVGGAVGCVAGDIDQAPPAPVARPRPIRTLPPPPPPVVPRPLRLPPGHELPAGFVAPRLAPTYAPPPVK